MSEGDASELIGGRHGNDLKGLACIRRSAQFADLGHAAQPLLAA